MKQPKPKMYFVYLEVSVAHSYGERPAPARDFAANERTEADDVLYVLQGFHCEQLG